MIVGHQPTLGEVVARLIGGAEGDLSFKKGAIWWLQSRERDGASEVVVRAVLSPDLL